MEVVIRRSDHLSRLKLDSRPLVVIRTACRAASGGSTEPASSGNAARPPEPASRCARRTGRDTPNGERAGQATNPKLASLETGEHARLDTLFMWLERNPQLHALYKHHVSSALPDLRPQMALTLALADHYMIRTDLDVPENILKSIELQARVARMGNEMVALERQLGPVTRAELDDIVDAIVHTLAQFVPEEQREKVAEFFSRRVCVPRLLSRRTFTEWIRDRFGSDDSPATGLR